MHTNKKISFSLVTLLLLLPAIGFAAAAETETKGSEYNMTLISLVSLVIILLFVIGVLANTLRQLSFSVKEKIYKDRKAASGIAKTVLMLIVCSLPALHSFAAAAAEPATPAATPAVTAIAGIPVMDYYVLITMLIVELTVIFALVIFIRILLRRLTVKLELQIAEKEAEAKKSWFWDNFNQAVPVEKEKDLLLDHNYDGIQELDNSLPPWWKYGFYLTIIVGIIYIYRFHVSHDGPSPQEEYAAEMQKGEEDKAAYLAHSANNVDEKTVTRLTDAGSISAGHDIFTKNCAPCHLPDGGGNVGPNLTDDYWLHGGGIADIFKSIKYGWQDKGMKSWKDDLSPKEIQEVASFIKSIHGSHPATPKAPQGELYIEASQTDKPADTTKAVDPKAAKVAVK